MKRHALLLVAASLFGFAGSAVAQTPTPQPEVQHPLDPLGWNEHWRVLEVLEASGRLTPKTRFTRIALNPPEKTKVLAWKPGAKPLPRQAEVRLKEGPNAIEAVVDLDKGTVTGWKVRSDVQPSWLIEEFLGAPVQAVMNHPDFKAKLKARGIESTRFLNCRAMPIGSHAEPKYAGKRIAIVRCDPVNGVRNLFVRRVEGLIAIVDVNTNEVLEISDDEVVPTTSTKADYDRANIGKLRSFPTSIALSQPDGPSFKIDGHNVTWGNWSFHLRSDQRVGTQISRLAWNEGGKTRDVMYEGYLSEIFVPYMDPRRDWYTRTLLDAGEYSMGGLSGPLTPGIDCPDTAAYMSGIITQDNGRPAEKDNVICIFERTTGDMSWRHADDGRPKRELVVRMVADLGNYDYVFDWVLESDGQFRVVTGATGIVAVQTSKAKHANDLVDGKRQDTYGRFVDDNVIGVNHDHYFNFRLDLDIDGPVNSFLKDELKTVRLPDDHPRRSLWVSEETTLGRESDGKLTTGHGNPTLWRVINPARPNRVGYPASYQLMLGHTAHTLFSKDDVPRQRAGFIDNDLWITAYDPNERYAAGEYAVLSAPGDGLPKFAAANRPIANADIVLWPTFGMQHKVRAEDWPVMPVLWHSITVRPFDFFDRNPAIDIDVKP